MDIFEPEILTPTCLEGNRKCHSNARCIDFPDGFCCECVPPFYGNGIQCVENGNVSIFNNILLSFADDVCQNGQQHSLCQILMSHFGIFNFDKR